MLYITWNASHKDTSAFHNEVKSKQICKAKKVYKPQISTICLWTLCTLIHSKLKENTHFVCCYLLYSLLKTAYQKRKVMWYSALHKGPNSNLWDSCNGSGYCHFCGWNSIHDWSCIFITVLHGFWSALKRKKIYNFFA